jgi:acyl carrier protein
LRLRGEFMEKLAQIEKIVFACVDRLNEQLPSELRVVKAGETVIVGEGAAIDSLSLVSLIVDIEENIASELRWTVNLLDIEFAGEAGPQFRTLGELVRWIGGHRPGDVK